ncbi:MAG: bifunctional DNA primase/polymerase [Candidatus Hadarchaeales archaeon]
MRGGTAENNAYKTEKTDPRQFETFVNLLPREIRKMVWYIPVSKNDKFPDVPAGRSWKEERLTEQQALARLRVGLNVGVVATPDTLAVIDIDKENLEVLNFIPPVLRETLTVKTRSGGLHLYYLNQGVENLDPSWSELDPKRKGRAMEVRANSRYVLSPGSFVPSSEGSGLYEVLIHRPPLPLSSASLSFLRGGKKEEAEPLNLKGFRVPPCVEYFLTFPVPDGGKSVAPKLLALAAVSLEGAPDLEKWKQAFIRAQCQGIEEERSRGRRKSIGGWLRWAARHRYPWTRNHCVAVRKYFWNLGILPPCGKCEVNWDARI